MAGPADADYVCSLDEKTLKKAKDELNEDPKNRIGAVETFRQWIKQQPYISCPTDITFLLPFLRTRYFSQLEARKLLENFLKRRSKFSHWFKNLDPNDPKIQAVFDAGAYLLLPERDAEGRRIMVVRPGRADPKTKLYSKIDAFRAFACLIDWMYLIDEVTSVNGTVHLIDFGGYTMSHQSYMSIDERRDFMQTWQSNYPARVKQIHIYNTGSMAELIFGLIKLLMPEKIQQRMKTHGQTLESIYNDIPMKLLPVEYLPDDYTGPSAGTEQQIIAWMKREMSTPAVRDRIQYLSQEKWGIDESKRPSAADGIPQASFRKLNID